MHNHKHVSDYYNTIVAPMAKETLKQARAVGVPMSRLWEALENGIDRAIDRFGEDKMSRQVALTIIGHIMSDKEIARQRADDVLRTMLRVVRLTGGDAVEFNFSRHMGLFLSEGGKVYECSAGLAQRLSQTEIRGVSTDLLRLPFAAVCLRVPPSAGLAYDELFIVEELPTPATEEIQLALDQVREENELGENEIPIIDGHVPRGWSMIGATMIKDGPNKGKIETSSLGGMTFIPGEDLQTTYERVDIKNAVDDFSKAFKFAVNMILYLSWPDEDEMFETRRSKDYEDAQERLKTLKGYKRDRLREKLKRMSIDERIYVGAKVPFLAGSEDEDGEKLRHQLLVRSLVAGHWKMQPHGPNRSERKLIRIEPYWRGPLDAPVKNTIRKAS